MAKILTIIIPTYNMEALLDKCLTSLIVGNEELQKSLEVLVVIDGAKDRSSEIAHTYQDKYPHIFRVIDKENGNYGSCVNRGLREASGKYIKVLDADDYFDTVCFEEYLNTLSNVDADVFINDYNEVDPDGNITRQISWKSPSCGIFGYHEFHEFDQWYFRMHGVAYKTEILRSFGYKQTEGISYTDNEWIFMPMAYCKTFYYFNKPLYQYLLGRDGQTMDESVWEKNFWMEVKGTRWMVDYFVENRADISDEGIKYLWKRLNKRAGVIFYSYFYKFKNGKHRETLAELDKHTKNVLPELWKEWDCKKAYHFIPYIRIWRKKGYPDRLWILDTLRTIKGLIRK